MILAGALPSCATRSAPIVVVASVAPETAPLSDEDPITPAERLLALLTEDNPRLERVAMSLASFGDAPSLRGAGERLVELARTVGTEAWRAREQARMEEAAAADDLVALTLAPVQLADRETQVTASILAAMSHVGGAAVVDHCFALAEDRALGWERRQLALRVLDRVLDLNDTPRRERRARLAQEIGDGVSPAVAVGSIQRLLRACYQRALAEEPAFSARVVVTLRPGPGGKVTPVFSGDRLPPSFERCIADAATSAATRIHPIDRRAPPEVALRFTVQP